MDSIRIEPATAHAVVVDVNCRQFGLTLASIVEVIRLDQELGADRIFRRGVEIPIVDLRKSLGEPERDHGMPMRIIVIRSSGGNVGLVVDGISRVMSGIGPNAPRAAAGWQWLDPKLIIPRIDS